MRTFWTPLPVMHGPLVDVMWRPVTVCPEVNVMGPDGLNGPEPAPMPPPPPLPPLPPPPLPPAPELLPDPDAPPEPPAPAAPPLAPAPPPLAPATPPELAPPELAPPELVPPGSESEQPAVRVAHATKTPTARSLSDTRRVPCSTNARIILEA
jgi:hypothetical protein